MQCLKHAHSLRMDFSLLPLSVSAYLIPNLFHLQIGPFQRMITFLPNLNHFWQQVEYIHDLQVEMPTTYFFRIITIYWLSLKFDLISSGGKNQKPYPHPRL